MTGGSDSSTRAPQAVLIEAQGLLTLRATERLYDEQPGLWSMGEDGRARTFEDFGHHFRSLSALDHERFAGHVAYCYDLFSRRSFPIAWLEDAWRVMADTLRAELPATVSGAAIAALRAGVAAGRPPKAAGA